MQKFLNHINSLVFHIVPAGLTLILLFHENSMQAQQSGNEGNLKIRTVVIDPGHGGKDPGAIGKKAKEKDIVLAIGLKLGKYIEDNIPDVRVVYTRKTDVFIPLYQRAEIANEIDADLFISLHVNSSNNPKPYGTESLVLGLHRSDENFEAAKRENSVILLEEDYTTRYENFDPNSLESYIVFSLMQNVYDHQSIGFAGMVQDQFRERARRKDRGVKRQGLLVLAQTTMPGVLVETGFISNENEERYLLTEEGQDYIASALYRAFRDYKADIEAKSNVGFSVDAELPEKNEPHTFSDRITDTSNSTHQLQQPADNSKSNSSDSTIYFKVQIASSSTSISLDSELFHEFTDVEEFKIESMYKYAVGYKNDYTDAIEYSKWVKNRHPDAFIVAVKNGSIIPLSSALKELGLN